MTESSTLEKGALSVGGTPLSAMVDHKADVSDGATVCVEQEDNDLHDDDDMWGINAVMGVAKASTAPIIVL